MLKQEMKQPRHTHRRMCGQPAPPTAHLGLGRMGEWREAERHIQFPDTNTDTRNATTQKGAETEPCEFRRCQNIKHEQPSSISNIHIIRPPRRRRCLAFGRQFCIIIPMPGTKTSYLDSKKGSAREGGMCLRAKWPAKATV